LRCSLDNRRAVAEFGLEQDIRVCEETFLQRNDNELRAFESRSEELANVLGMGQIEGGVDLVEDVHGCRLELEQSHDQ
jgi:hypothetical protein